MTSQPEQFIQEILPHALQVQKEHGIPASLVIAQAAQETGWGLKVKGNNYFGMKANKNWHGATVNAATHEFENGKYVRIKAAFRAYESMADSVLNYGAMLAGSKRYNGVTQATNGLEAVDVVANAGYATDQEYAKNLKNLITQYNLTRFDDKQYEGYTKDDKKFDGFLKSLFEVLGNLISSITKFVFGPADHNSVTPPTVQSSKVAATAVVKS